MSLSETHHIVYLQNWKRKNITFYKTGKYRTILNFYEFKLEKTRREDGTINCRGQE